MTSPYLINPPLTTRERALVAFIRQLSRMDTPTDGVADDEDFDDIMADLDDDRLCSDASALYEMIRDARTLVAEIDGKPAEGVSS